MNPTQILSNLNILKKAPNQANCWFANYEMAKTKELLLLFGTELETQTR